MEFIFALIERIPTFLLLSLVLGYLTWSSFIKKGNFSIKGFYELTDIFLLSLFILTGIFFLYLIGFGFWHSFKLDYDYSAFRNSLDLFFNALLLLLLSILLIGSKLVSKNAMSKSKLGRLLFWVTAILGGTLVLWFSVFIRSFKYFVGSIVFPNLLFFLFVMFILFLVNIMSIIALYRKSKDNIFGYRFLWWVIIILGSLIIGLGGCFLGSYLFPLSSSNLGSISEYEISNWQRGYELNQLIFSMERWGFLGWIPLYMGEYTIRDPLKLYVIYNHTNPQLIEIKDDNLDKLGIYLINSSLSDKNIVIFFDKKKFEALDVYEFLVDIKTKIQFNNNSLIVQTSENPREGRNYSRTYVFENKLDKDIMTDDRILLFEGRDFGTDYVNCRFLDVVGYEINSGQIYNLTWKNGGDEYYLIEGLDSRIYLFNNVQVAYLDSKTVNLPAYTTINFTLTMSC